MYNSRLSCAQFLLESGADVNAQTFDRMIPMHYTSYECAPLLLQYGGHLDSKDENGYTPLHIAACKEDSSLLRFFLQNHVNVNARTNRGDTVVHLAAEDYPENLTLLLQEDIDFNSINNNNETPCHNALSNEECLRLLLTRNPDLSIKNWLGHNILHSAVSCGLVKSITMILKHDKSLIDNLTDSGMSVFYLALERLTIGKILEGLNVETMNSEDKRIICCWIMERISILEPINHYIMQQQLAMMTW